LAFKALTRGNRQNLRDHDGIHHRLETIHAGHASTIRSHRTSCDYDRGLKFKLYRTIPTLRDYLLIDQYSIDVEHRFLDGSRWETNRYDNPADVVQLTGISVALRVEAIYDLVDFSPPPHDH
jgi:hypothetical protein